MIKQRIAAFFFVIALSVSSTALLSSGLQAQQAESRSKQIGGKFMCMCGCSQVLTQCNHVGCATSASMLKELDQAVARGETETAITSEFVQEFGTKVYAEPPKSGLSLVAWSLPSIYLLLGTMLVVFVIWKWRLRAMPTPATVGGTLSRTPGISTQDIERARQRVTQETED
jgi:cytochrome c-type biogenesis protein CcmH